MSGKSILVVGSNPSFEYEITQIIRLFFEADDLQFVAVMPIEPSFVLHFQQEDSSDGQMLQCELLDNGLSVLKQREFTPRRDDATEESYQRESKRAYLRVSWRVFASYTGRAPAWGILYGVRPTKVAHELLAEGYEDTTALQILEERFCMAPRKGELILEVARKERRFIQPADPASYALYFGIPFCPSRCSYCSFPAFTGTAKFKLIPAYVDAMIQESAKVSGGLTNRYADSVYIGGGTPTMLSAEQLDTLLEHIGSAYDLSRCREITVEAGRPDTITREKLFVMRKHGVDRICLNPQSFNDETLKRIGRQHEAGQMRPAVELIREMAFKTLNMDIILGLPGETLEDVAATLDAVAAIAPENLTVHTLALKRGSELRQQEQISAAVETMEAMLTQAATSARGMGLEPYYMYRQKFMLANLENVGYARPGHECIYNMQIMEEQQDILSFGTGGVSKICFTAENRHERVPNVRGLEEYLARFNEMADRKLRMLEQKLRLIP